MNLSTANSAKRAAEVGVRKVLGAQKQSLLRQFLGESLIMAGIALILALLFSFSFITCF
jgi:putative ABC transport system permease protein